MKASHHWSDWQTERYDKRRRDPSEAMGLQPKKSYSQEDRKAVEHTLDDDFEPSGYGSPTDARPGSWEKLEVLAQRVEAGLHLWHPDDFVLDQRMFEPAEWTVGYRGNRSDPRVMER